MKGTYQLELSKQMALTRSRAEAYLGLPDLPGERHPTPKHTDTIVNKMETGEFMGHHVRISTVRVGRKTYKLNGQTTCMARLKFNGTANYRVYFDEYKAATMTDAAALYGQFDPSWASRSYGHLFKAYNTNTGMYDRVGNWRILFLSASAIAFDRGGRTEYGRRGMSSEDRCTLPSQEPKKVEILHQICPDRDTASHLLRDGVCSAIYQTIKLDPAAAQKFWAKVRDGEMLTRGDPAKRLERYLWSIVRTKANGGGVPTDPFRKIYAKCIHAWNAFRTNGTTDLKYYVSAPLPEAK